MGSKSRIFLISILAGLIGISIILFLSVGAMLPLIFPIVLILLVLLSTSKLLKSAFLIVAVIELLLNFASPYKSYSERNGSYWFSAPFYKPRIPKPKPNKTSKKKRTEFNFTHYYNSSGFRDVDNENKSYHTIIIGDSFVEGFGVDKDETIDKRLEQLVNCRDCILNTGLSGSDLINHFSIFSDLLDKGYHTNYVLLNINKSDRYDLIARHNEYELEFDNLPSPYFQYLYGYSFIFRHFSRQILNYNLDLIKENDEHLAFSKAEKEMIAYLYNYESLCSENSIKLFVLFQPMQHEIESNHLELGNVISAVQEDIETINLLHFPKSEPHEIYWELDQHFNDLGYVEYSQSIFDSIMSRDSSFFSNSKTIH